MNVTRRDTNSQIMGLEIGGKKRERLSIETVRKCVKTDLARFRLKQKDADDRERWRSQVKAKIAKSGLQR